MIKLSASRKKFILEIFAVLVVCAFLVTPLVPSIGHFSSNKGIKLLYDLKDAKQSSSQSNPIISEVNFQNNSGTYTISISGSNFGVLGGLPYNGDTSYFRIADAAQLGYGEWGYNGDSKTLLYQSWNDTNIVVSGFIGNPGDAVTIALWNPQTSLGVTWGGNIPTPPSSYPIISSIQFTGSGQNLRITINGNNFGSSPVLMPYSGDLNYLQFIDFRAHSNGGSSLFSAGFKGWNVGSPDSVTLNFSSWTNKQIIISGFGGTYGQNGAVAQTGDPISIIIWSTNDNGYTGPQTGWGGFINTANESTIYPITFTETGLLSGTTWYADSIS